VIRRRGAANVSAGLAHRIDAAEHDVVDERGIELVAAPVRPRAPVWRDERRTSCSAPSCLAAPARRAHVIVDEGIGMVFLLNRVVTRETAYPFI